MTLSIDEKGNVYEETLEPSYLKGLEKWKWKPSLPTLTSKSLETVSRRLRPGIWKSIPWSANSGAPPPLRVQAAAQLRSLPVVPVAQMAPVDHLAIRMDEAVVVEVGMKAAM